jgi:serine/threonine protein kinase
MVDIEPPKDLVCPIGMELMQDPVIAADGSSYERANIEQWLQEHDTSPVTNEPLTHKNLVPNRNLRGSIEDWQRMHLKIIPRQSLEPAGDFTTNPAARQIGVGSFKRVFEANYTRPAPGGGSETRKVAVLLINSGECEAEIATFIKIGAHPNLVEFIGQCDEPQLKHRLLVCEFAEFGSLDAALDAERVPNISACITIQHKKTMMQQIAFGMAHLNEKGFVHRDLALRNVLLFGFKADDLEVTLVKVCDYGLTVQRDGRSYRRVEGRDVPTRYFPPEALENESFSEKSDVWAFGVTAWELLTNARIMPYFDTPEAELVMFVVGGGRLQRPGHGDMKQYGDSPESLWKIVESCWSSKKADRPTFNRLHVSLGTCSVVDEPQGVPEPEEPIERVMQWPGCLQVCPWGVPQTLSEATNRCSLARCGCDLILVRAPAGGGHLQHLDEIQPAG